MKITKSQVIEAIKTEHLKPGKVFHVSPEHSYATCPVCAVGAVLRNSHQWNSVEISNIQDINNNVTYNYFDNNPLFSFEQDLHVTCTWREDAYLRKGHYLSALSGKFEFLCEEYSFTEEMATIRKELIEWVRQYIPDEFEC